MRPRKRLRKENTHKKCVSHQKVQKGLKHFFRSGNPIAEKRFEPQRVCPCKLKCHLKIDEEQQHVHFESFYNFPDWTKKTLFLRSSIDRKEVNRKLSNLNLIIQLKNRNYTYRYFLLDIAGKFVLISSANAFK